MISPTKPLPQFQQGVGTILDATTQPGYSQIPIIQIDGQRQAVAGDGLSDGLTLPAHSDGSTIRGLDIYGFRNGAGIRLEWDSKPGPRKLRRHRSIEEHFEIPTALEP